MQPSNEAELCNAVATAIAIDDQPSCFRFPRGNGIGADFAQNGVAKNHKGTPWEVSARALSCRSAASGWPQRMHSRNLAHYWQTHISGENILTCIAAWARAAHEGVLKDEECCADR